MLYEREEEILCKGKCWGNVEGNVMNLNCFWKKNHLSYFIPQVYSPFVSATATSKSIISSTTLMLGKIFNAKINIWQKKNVIFLVLQVPQATKNY